MPVNTLHPDYEAASERWQRCRDAYDGTDAIKARGKVYLPPLDSHTKYPDDYRDYVKRAVYYNATGRTVDGLVGALFQRPPEVKADRIEDDLADITLDGKTLHSFCRLVTQGVMLTGRDSILVEMPPDDGRRPYWCQYPTEDIINWRTERRAGDDVLVQVVLREQREKRDGNDEYETKSAEQFLVLDLDEQGLYRQRRFEKREGRDENDKPRFELVEEAFPVRRGQRLDFIPFAPATPMGVSIYPAKPPVLDMVDLNLAHYRNSGDFEHGLHYTGVPVPWFAGPISNDDSEIEIGPRSAIMLEANGKAGILQADGALLGALTEAMDKKERQMAILGARLLEEQPRQAETFGAVSFRHLGEHATLRGIAGAIEATVTQALRWHDWWSGNGALLPTPADSEAEYKISRDFMAAMMTPGELKDLVFALQSDAISYPTFYAALQRGGLARPGVDAETELAEIGRQGGGGAPREE